MADNLANMISQAVHKSPEWVRRELLADDPSLRQRAEETMAAMIAAALYGEAWGKFAGSGSASGHSSGEARFPHQPPRQNLKKQTAEEPNF